MASLLLRMTELYLEEENVEGAIESLGKAVQVLGAEDPHVLEIQNRLNALRAKKNEVVKIFDHSAQRTSNIDRTDLAATGSGLLGWGGHNLEKESTKLEAGNTKQEVHESPARSKEEAESEVEGKVTKSSDQSLESSNTDKKSNTEGSASDLRGWGQQNLLKRNEESKVSMPKEKVHESHALKEQNSKPMTQGRKGGGLFGMLVPWNSKADKHILVPRDNVDVMKGNGPEELGKDRDHVSLEDKANEQQEVLQRDETIDYIPGEAHCKRFIDKNDLRALDNIIDPQRKFQDKSKYLLQEKKRQEDVLKVEEKSNNGTSGWIVRQGEETDESWAKVASNAPGLLDATVSEKEDSYSFHKKESAKVDTITVSSGLIESEAVPESSLCELPEDRPEKALESQYQKCTTYTKFTEHADDDRESPTEKKEDNTVLSLNGYNYSIPVEAESNSRLGNDYSGHDLENFMEDIAGGENQVEYFHMGGDISPNWSDTKKNITLHFSRVLKLYPNNATEKNLPAQVALTERDSGKAGEELKKGESFISNESWPKNVIKSDKHSDDKIEGANGEIGFMKKEANKVSLEQTAHEDDSVIRHERRGSGPLCDRELLDLDDWKLDLKDDLHDKRQIVECIVQTHSSHSVVINDKADRDEPADDETGMDNLMDNTLCDGIGHSLPDNDRPAEQRTTDIMRKNRTMSGEKCSPSEEELLFSETDSSVLQSYMEDKTDRKQERMDDNVFQVISNNKWASSQHDIKEELTSKIQKQHISSDGSSSKSIEEDPPHVKVEMCDYRARIDIPEASADHSLSSNGNPIQDTMPPYMSRKRRESRCKEEHETQKDQKTEETDSDSNRLEKKDNGSVGSSGFIKDYGTEIHFQKLDGISINSVQSQAKEEERLSNEDCAFYELPHKKDKATQDGSEYLTYHSLSSFDLQAKDAVHIEELEPCGHKGSHCNQESEGKQNTQSSFLEQRMDNFSTKTVHSQRTQEEPLSDEEMTNYIWQAIKRDTESLESREHSWSSSVDESLGSMDHSWLSTEDTGSLESREHSRSSSVDKSLRSRNHPWSSTGKKRVEQDGAPSNDDPNAHEAFRLGRDALDSGDEDHATRLFQEALSLLRDELGESHSAYAAMLHQIGSSYLQQGNREEALRYYDDEVLVLEATLGERHPAIVDLLYFMGGVWLDDGNAEEALQCYEEVLMMWRIVLGPSHEKIEDLLLHMGGINRDEDRFQNALRMYDQALHMRRARLGEDHTTVADILILLSELYSKENYHTVDAIECSEKALRIRKLALGENHPEITALARKLSLLHVEKRVGKELMTSQEDAANLFEAASKAGENG